MLILLYSSPSGSLPTSVLARSLSGCHAFNNSHGTVGGNEGLVGDATDVGFVYLVEIVHLVEELAPIAIARLIQGKVRSQALVAVKTAQQVGLGSGPDHLQFVVADVFFFRRSISL